ncbi:Chaperone DnaJ-domain superfamily protein [Zea mays]|uniref:Chaperone DnaJ-domain superfamily protein n=2 Tax=Zea mays TaxID=4577 RepID=A0A1D6HMB4_MAIZE|nr:Chaperone DnaJ-domain superfamily protein [Zea mays]
MDAGGEKCGDAAAEGGDLYAVLGLKKECSEAELKVAYRKLAKVFYSMKWGSLMILSNCSTEMAPGQMLVLQQREAHGGSQGEVPRDPGRLFRSQSSFSQHPHTIHPPHCSVPSIFANHPFTLLSDANKRLLYDVGVYDDEDDEESMQGMGDFIGEMAQMMSQAQPTRQESFEELQQLFVDMFQSDIDSGFCNRTAKAHQFQGPAKSRTCSTSPSSSPSPPPTTAKDAEVPSCNGFNKRGSSALDSGKPPKPVEGGAGQNQAGFCFGVSDTKETPKLPGQNASRRRNGRKQKLSSKHDVSSEDETAAGS